MEASQPPVPPQVAAQQGPPIRQFAQGAGPAGGAADTGQNPDALLGQLVDEAGKTLTKIAQITSQTKPELVPILKQAVQALVMFAGKIKTGQQGAGQGAPQQGSPDGGNQGTAADTAPDAGGGAAMGMQQ